MLTWKVGEKRRAQISLLGATLERLKRRARDHDVDDGEDQMIRKAVDGVGRSKEGSRVVEDEVDTGPLLHHLKRGTENGPSQVGPGVTETAGETAGPGSQVAVVRDEAFVLVVGDDFGELVLTNSENPRVTTNAART